MEFVPVMKTRVIANRYQLEEFLRKKAEEIYRAIDLKTEENVLIALYYEHSENDLRWYDQFISQIQLINQINHPNINQILDYGETDDSAYLVYEYTPHQTLAELLEKQGPLPLGVALTHMVELADALARLHHIGISHRDIHPKNILITEKGLLLTDFGLANYVVREGMVAGIPAYISPEAARGEHESVQRDSWAFGIVLYELLTGTVPFDGDEANSTLLSIVHDPLPDITRMRPNLPPRLVALINWILTKDPQQRLTSMRQIGAELEAILEDVKAGFPAARSTRQLSSGQLIGGRYELQMEIGSGHFGRVYRAADLQSGEIVAVKQLRPEIAGDPANLERFRRESRALQKLNHPGILEMFDTIETGEEHFLILEYIAGGDLSKLIEGETLSIQEIVLIALELSDAIARAHHLNIIHRDIKPENILITLDGSPKLTDFGVARMETQDKLTLAGQIVGTIDYIAPEVLQGQMASHLSDIWSFGIMLYEMIAGERPFQGEIMTQLLISILTSPLPDIRGCRSDLPEALVELVESILQREPLDRIGSMREISLRLERISSHLT